MKKNIIYRMAMLLSIFVIGSASVSCDSFLDRQEDENMTFEKIWDKVSTTQAYFFQCMGYMPTDGEDIFGTYGSQYLTHAYAATDESSMCWSWGYQNMTFGSWNASGLPNDEYNRYYEAIRDCNIFLQNVMNCRDSQAVQADLKLWYDCVRFARAYYYFILMRDFGPVFLMGDHLVDANESLDDLARRRDSWEDCYNYVVSEMQYCVDNLEATYASGRMGLPTKGAALAVISRLSLYNARPLFNGNSLYRNVGVNDNNEPLFPRDFDGEKWVEAAAAAKAVIDLGTYSLYRDDSGDPYLNYRGIMMEHWNSELIFSQGGYRNRFYWGVHTRPAGATGSTAYGGWGPTQQQVDAYAMENGRYPIDHYENDGTPVVDAASGYDLSTEFNKTSMWANPYLVALEQTTTQADTPQMYIGREPRFYVSVIWGGSIFSWAADSKNITVSFANGGNSHASHDYPHSGYLVNRYLDITQAEGTWGSITYPTFRLGEIYLNYIEAVLNCEKYGVSGEAVDHNYAMQLWDELRDRSGMAPITEVYPEAISTDALLDLLQRERRVELAFEGHRYYDTRTWMIAEQTDNGPMWGMDTMTAGSGADTPDSYWVRTAFENRVFKKQHYLFPFPQRELDRNRLLDQNYGW